ncbi:hypothetical protein CKAH01_00446 [Colletotrichum kahawae]|uniref:Uncharacterized protein n=1 Tax=Colletotrichum kahawae TaxID=34407 RepID=A0AAD9YWE7_COLKA|nr:hypothetical protein CKAH01_00446 [Colletotrichum kahawae]
MRSLREHSFQSSHTPRCGGGWHPSQSQQTLAQGIQDRLAPHQANGHVVHLKRIPWLKWPRQIQDWVRRIDRQRQVDVIWPVMDEASIQAGKHDIGYAWVVCESKYAASRLAREVNHYSRRNTCFGRTLEASHAKHPRALSSNGSSAVHASPGEEVGSIDITGLIAPAHNPDN